MTRVILCIVAALFLYPKESIAQAAPMKRANRIVVMTDDGYKKAAQALILRGFSIVNSDSELGIITTDFKESKRGAIQVNIVVSGDRVSIKGKGSLNVNVGKALGGDWMKDDPPSLIDYRGQRGSPGGRHGRRRRPTPAR